MSAYGELFVKSLLSKAGATGLFVCAAVVLASGAAWGKGEGDPAGSGPSQQLPWALRDHYEVTVGKATLFYAVENAEWRVVVDGVGPVIDGVGFCITFADGTTLDAAGLGSAESKRESVSGKVGKATAFWSEFPPKEGLSVRHSMTVHRDYPFLLVRLELRNGSEKPLEIAKIAPVVIPPAGIANLSVDTDANARRLFFRGGFPMLGEDGSSALTLFNDRANDLSFSLGVMPRGSAESNVELARHGPAWQGEVASVYDPPIRIDPGKKIEADPVWLSAAIPKPSRIDMYYAWASSEASRPESDPSAPLWWVTVDDGRPESQLHKAIGNWSDAGRAAALVPATWEGRPGSMQGATPAYPKNMTKAAKALKDMGVKPGITVDPVPTDAPGGDWTASSADGRTWLNLSVPAGRRHAVERMRKVVEWGFEFFVIRPSAIPDEVLRHFNMTRVQADTLAFAVMREAADGLPVLPSVAVTLKADLEQWLDAAASSSRLAEYGVAPGPVRLNVDGLSEIDDDLVTAMAFFCGPIELVGRPRPEVKEKLSPFLSRFRIPARPLDAAKRSPRLWQVRVRNPEKGAVGDTVVMFPNAPSWTLDDLEIDGEEPVNVWDTKDGGFVDLEQGAVQSPDRLTLYGVVPDLARPMLLGASGSTTALLDDVKALTWDEDEMMLSGSFRSGNSARAIAYVHIPKGWAYKSGKVGDATIRAKHITNRIAFPVEPGRATHFGFEFEKK